AVLADLNEACGDEPSGLCENVYDFTDSENAAQFVEWLTGPPLRVILIVVLAWVLARLARRWVARFVDGFVDEHRANEEEAAERRDLFSPIEERALERLREYQNRSERSRQRAVTLGSLLSSVLTFIIWTTAVLLVLAELGLNLGPLLAGAGIAGVALSFGAQSLVKDFLSGVFIVFEDQYGVGDNVDLGEAEGTVERVSLRTTRVRDVEGTLWIVPNGEIRRVANHSQLWARTVLDIDVAYDTDLEQAMAVIEQTAVGLWEEEADETTILEQPEVWGVQQLGQSAVVIRLAVKTEPSEQWATARVLRQLIKVALDDAGIEIPYPHQVVELRPIPSDAAPA
ncbi:MAG: mechanosensitive ion channel family protein, partial [Acidimicrobiia bacterium]|nr:mechanosensitive ion channel family protein [Acidimicrobiia bacterium]